MMKCKELESHAIAYLDGKLPPSERSVVEQHLALCAACRERVQGVSSVMGLLDEWPDVRPSPFFQTRLAARLQEEPVAAGWWQSLWLDRPSRPAAGPVFAVALAVVMIVGVVLLQYSPSPLDSQELDGSGVTLASTAPDELPLYQDLPLLEDYEVLRNFEVLQILGNTNLVVQ